MSRKPDAAPGVLTRDSTVMWDEVEGFLWLLLAMDLRLKKDKWGRGGGTNWTREWGGGSRCYGGPLRSQFII